MNEMMVIFIISYDPEIESMLNSAQLSTGHLFIYVCTYLFLWDITSNKIQQQI